VGDLAESAASSAACSAPPNNLLTPSQPQDRPRLILEATSTRSLPPAPPHDKTDTQPSLQGQVQQDDTILSHSAPLARWCCSASTEECPAAPPRAVPPCPLKSSPHFTILSQGTERTPHIERRTPSCCPQRPNTSAIDRRDATISPNRPLSQGLPPRTPHHLLVSALP
jgi:hypothetical protein